MKESELLIESGKILAVASFAAICTVGWYCKKRINSYFFSDYGGSFGQCSIDELNELKIAFNEYHRVSTQQHQDIKIIREALNTLRGDLEQKKRSLALVAESSTHIKLIEIDQVKLITVSRLLSEYPVLSESVKKASEIEKLRIEREEYHEKVKLAFADFLTDIYSSLKSLQIENEGLSVVSVGNKK